MQKVLIIDDNMIMSSKINNILKSNNFNTRTLPFMKVNFLEKIKEFEPDIIFINLEAKTYDPLSIINDTKQLYPNTKIIGYAGHKNKELMEKAKNLKADFAVANSKVISWEKMEKVLNECCI